MVIADLDGQAAEDAPGGTRDQTRKMPHGRRFGTLVTIQGYPSFVRHNWISSSLSSSFGGSTNLSGVGPVHAADLCGRVTTMWLRIGRW